jgi:hypothetical protein
MGSTLRDDDVSPGLIHRHTSSDLIEHDFHLSCAHVTEGAVEPTSGWLFLAAIFFIFCIYKNILRCTTCTQSVYAVNHGPYGGRVEISLDVYAPCLNIIALSRRKCKVTTFWQSGDICCSHIDLMRSKRGAHLRRFSCTASECIPTLRRRRPLDLPRKAYSLIYV